MMFVFCIRNFFFVLYFPELKVFTSVIHMENSV
jgi:hypothetical protein